MSLVKILLISTRKHAINVFDLPIEHMPANSESSSLNQSSAPEKISDYVKPDLRGDEKTGTPSTKS